MKSLKNSVKILFVNPSYKGDPFWDSVTHLMVKTAQNLNIRLYILYGHRQRWSTEDALEFNIQLALKSQDPYDGVILQNHKKSGPSLIQITEKYKLHSIMINSGLDFGLSGLSELNEKQFFQEHPHFLGGIIPDDRRAGKELLDILIQGFFQEEGEKGIPQILVLSGPINDESGLQRYLGLSDEIKLWEEQHPKTPLEIVQFLNGDWDYLMTKRKLAKIKNKLKEVNIVWAANDSMAIAARDYFQENFQKIPLIGGIDWNEKAIEAIKQQQLVTSLGGHFLEGVWALIMMSDFLRIQPFINQIPEFPEIKEHLFYQKWYKTSLIPFQDYINLEQFNFKNLSKVYHYDLTQDYPFFKNVYVILDQISSQSF